MGKTLLSEFRVRLLGPMMVEAGGHEITVSGRKQRILLAHLVLSGGRPVPIGRLQADLWPDAAPKDPVHALQEHVSRLRLTTGLEVNFIEGAGYQVPAVALRSDVREFSRVAAEARKRLQSGEYRSAIGLFEEALRMWQDPVMEDLAAVDGLRAHMAQLEQEWKEAASDRMEAYLRSGRPTDVIGELRTLLEVDPLHERSWYQLVLALHLAGKRTEALLAFNEAREGFIEAIGVEPSPRLLELHEMVLRSGSSGAGSTDMPPEEGAVLQKPDPAGPGRIGRDMEMELIESAWRKAHNGVQIVTISGEPGVGKSFLAAEFASRVAGGSGTVLTGTNQREVTSAYHLFAQVLRDSLRHVPDGLSTAQRFRHSRGLTRVMPEVAGGDFEEESVEVRAWETMDAVAAWFEELGSRAPVTVVLENLHWADPESIRLIGHLLQTPRRIRMLCLVTVRDSELEEFRDGAHPAPHLFRQASNVTHIPLARMSEEETAALVTRETAGVRLPPWARGYIQRASGGNPFFAIELARHLMISKVTHEDAVGTPMGMQHVIDGHVDSLPGQTPQLLRCASIFSAPFESEAIAAVAQMSGEAVESALTRAQDAGLLVAQRGRTFSFSHDVVNKVLYDSLPLSRRSELHRRAARFLKGRGSPESPDHHVALAHHLRNAGSSAEKQEAVGHLLNAGRQALGVGAPESAEGFLTGALDLLHPFESSAVRCDVLTSLGVAQLHCGRREYRSTLLEAARIGTELGDRERLITAVLQNTRGWWSVSAEIDHDRVASIEAALAACGTADEASRARLLVMWAQENVRDPARRRDVLGTSAQALDLAEALGDPMTLATVLAGRYAVLYALFERPAECVVLSRRLLRLAQRHGMRAMTLSGAIGKAQSSMRFGNFQVADRYLDHALQLAESLNHPPRRWLVKGWKATRDAMRGRFDEAEKGAERAYELGVRSGKRDAPIWFAGQLFAIRSLQGRLGEILPELRTQAAQFGDAIPAWNAALALGLAKGGEHAEAERVLERLAAEEFAAMPYDILWLQGMCYLAKVCEETGRTDLGTVVYRLLAPYSGMVATNGTIDAGPVDLYLGALARLTGNGDTARTHLQSAITQCRRMDAPVWQEEAGRLLVAT